MTTTGLLAGRPGWRRELAHRVVHHFVLKMLGITAFMWVFFVAYFHLLRNPVHPVTVMPLTALDTLIGFQPLALGAYLTLWFYLGIVPGLMPSLRELVVYGFWVGGLCLAGLACFYWWPSAVPAVTLDVTGHPAFALLQGVDAAGNACPSLHVATAMFTAIWLDHVLRDIGTPALLRVVNAVWFVAIAYSTLAIKQHVAVDVAAGAALGLIFAWPSLHRRRRH